MKFKRIVDARQLGDRHVGSECCNICKYILVGHGQRRLNEAGLQDACLADALREGV